MSHMTPTCKKGAPRAAALVGRTTDTRPAWDVETADTQTAVGPVRADGRRRLEAPAYSSVFTSVTSFDRLALASPKSMLVFSS